MEISECRNKSKRGGGEGEGDENVDKARKVVTELNLVAVFFDVTARSWKEGAFDILSDREYCQSLSIVPSNYAELPSPRSQHRNFRCHGLCRVSAERTKAFHDVCFACRVFVALCGVYRKHEKRQQGT